MTALDTTKRKNPSNSTQILCSFPPFVLILNPLGLLSSPFIPSVQRAFFALSSILPVVGCSHFSTGHAQRGVAWHGISILTYLFFYLFGMLLYGIHHGRSQRGLHGLLLERVWIYGVVRYSSRGFNTYHPSKNGPDACVQGTRSSHSSSLSLNYDYYEPAGRLFQYFHEYP